jgi:hypothetical protein
MNGLTSRRIYKQSPRLPQQEEKMAQMSQSKEKTEVQRCVLTAKRWVD